MSDKHTPGPWMAHHAEHRGPKVRDAHGNPICSVTSGMDGDAELIAAAPAMRDALLLIARCLECDGSCAECSVAGAESLGIEFAIPRFIGHVLPDVSPVKSAGTIARIR